LVALAAPIAILTGRTGNLALGHALVGASLAAALSLAAIAGGGLAAPAMLGLTLVPLEAALSGRRSVVIVAVAIVTAAALAVAGADAARLAAAVPTDTAGLRVGILFGLVYIAGLILRMDVVHRVGAVETARARDAMHLM
ncbi:hypothetical protein J8J27_22695, partial [Mycobacterium tuberculosis]|nr:hypothetical protein [Mycobacterium tuberculosis]